MRRFSTIALTTGVMIAGAAGVYLLAVVPIQCNRHLLVINQRTERALRETTKREGPALARQNLADLNRCARVCRTDVDIYLLLAANEQILDRKEQALRHLDRALRIDDRPEVYYRRGLLLLEMRRVDAAVAELARAVEFKPVYADFLEGELRRNVAAAAEERRKRRPESLENR